MGLELDTEISSILPNTEPPNTEPSTSIFISSSDLNLLKDTKVRATILLKDAQLAELQKQNLLLQIYLKYSLPSAAEINEETGEVFYPKK